MRKAIETCGGDAEMRLPLAQLVRFSAELSNSFSKYYSKVHILEVRNIFRRNSFAFKNE